MDPSVRRILLQLVCEEKKHEVREAVTEKCFHFKLLVMVYRSTLIKRCYCSNT